MVHLVSSEGEATAGYVHSGKSHFSQHGRKGLAVIVIVVVVVAVVVIVVVVVVVR